MRDHTLEKTLIASSLEEVVPNCSSSTAVNGIYGIGLVETNYKTRQQYGGGPALGFWQMEPRTHDDIWKNYLPSRPPLHQAILKRWPNPSSSLLLGDDAYGCIMCRTFLLRIPAPLPEASDYKGWARYWKEYYNTAGGAGTISYAENCFREACIP